MPNFSVKLKPVYSRPASHLPAGIKLPNGWDSLSWHQVETFEALSDPDLDIVFNTAMTGDGKSLAAYLKAMTGLNSTLAMYPTNELARDQERQVQDYKDKFSPEYDPQIYRLTGATLEKFVETNQLSTKQQGIINRINNSEILLTNPDIFHYIHDFRYLRRNSQNPRKGDNSDKLFRKLDESYKFFVFDEFHIFSSPQISSILNALLLIKHTAKRRKFLFLSATPVPLLRGFLERSGFSCKDINPIKEGAYAFSSDEAQGWRQISHPITLSFPEDLQPNSQSSYGWITENAESVILNFFLEHQNSKGAIILNSIASVYRLLAKLKPLFKQHDLTVLPNTSLTGESERGRSIQDADLLIGTSTIDVGVDFKINFLIFEASDAGNFIQRFGRLGRHKGFPIYQAYALVPNFLVARLFTGKEEVCSPALIDGEEYDRIYFTDKMRESWSFVNQFEEYPSRWGSLQSVCMHMELRSKHMTETYPKAQDGYRTDVEKALRVNLKHKYGQVAELLKLKQNKIVEEARSFRGSSQLDCAVYDITNPDEPELDRFKSYHLPGLLSNFVIEPIEKKVFLQKAEGAGLSIKRFENALCYLKLLGFQEVRKNWHFYYDRSDFSDIRRLRQVQILKNLQVTTGWNSVSKALSARGMVCFISDHDQRYLRSKLGLPMHFQSYGLSDHMDDLNPPYTIAFGQSALMLETLVRFWKSKDSEPLIY
jgi:CRISPR-associated endonuclease/helicase Cas3